MKLISSSRTRGLVFFEHSWSDFCSCSFSMHRFLIATMLISSRLVFASFIIRVEFVHSRSYFYFYFQALTVFTCGLKFMGVIDPHGHQYNSHSFSRVLTPCIRCVGCIEPRFHHLNSGPFSKGFSNQTAYPRANSFQVFFRACAFPLLFSELLLTPAMTPVLWVSLGRDARG